MPRSSGLPFTLAQLDEFRAVPGVEAIAPVYSTRGSQLPIDGRQRSTTLIVIDTAEMREVQAGRADATPLPEALAGDGGVDGVPVLLSGLVDGLIATADDVELDGEPFQVAGVVDGTTAYSPRGNWVLMDRANARPFTDTLVPRAVLVRFAPGADPRPSPPRSRRSPARARPSSRPANSPRNSAGNRPRRVS